MFNSPQFYAELGRKAAEARNQHDEARAAFHGNHFRRARQYENADAAVEAGALFDEAYKEARHVKN